MVLDADNGKVLAHFPIGKGVDAVVFSGRYVSCSAVVAHDVLPHLERAGGLALDAAQWMIFAKPLEGVLAEMANLQ